MYDGYVMSILGAPDGLVVISIFVVGGFHMAANRHAPEQRTSSLFVTPLYLLVGVLIVSFLQTRLMPERDSYGDVRLEQFPAIIHLLAWVKVGVFIAAMLVFISDLQSLRAGPDADEKEQSEDAYAELTGTAAADQEKVVDGDSEPHDDAEDNRPTDAQTSKQGQSS